MVSEVGNNRVILMYDLNYTHLKLEFIRVEVENMYDINYIGIENVVCIIQLKIYPNSCRYVVFAYTHVF